MAVLKDLIVHGPSKFIGKTQFNTINAGSIGAREGIFNKLIATTLKAETATIDDLTAENATVVGLLDVQGKLHTNAWTNANIANIGGSFYISPSVESVSGKITINKNTSNWTVQITGKFATDFIKTTNSTTASAWPENSLVLVTGNVVVNKIDYPLGTLKGTLTGQVDATDASREKTITMTCASDYRDNPNADVLQMLYEANGNANITTADFSNGKISMYKISGTKPIGILLSSVGITAKGSNYIDIYGGTNNDGTPNLRIGHLTGLQATVLNGKSMTPTGWGLYADNAYLSGTIHSAAGIIGGFTIDGNSLHSGTFGTANSVLVSTGTSSAANIADSGSISGWAFTAGATYGVTKTGVLYATGAYISGTLTAGANSKIGPWNITTSSIYKGNATHGTAGSGNMYFGDNGLSISNTFKVSNAGALTATGGSIAGWSFNATSLYKTNATPGYSAATMVISTGTKSKKNIGEGGTDEKTWMLSAGTGFGVTTAGKLYATGAVIKGKITATSGSFDSVSATNFTFTSGSIAGAVKIGGSSGDSASTVLNNITNAANTAKSYITDIDSNNGIIIKAILGTDDTNTQTGNYIKLNATDGLLVYKGGSRVASFGSTVELGSGSFTAKISSSSFSIHRFGSMYCYADISYDSVNKGPSYLFGELVALEPGNPGLYSMSSGLNSNGEGYCSRASGYYIKANTDYQTAIGKYNNNNSSNAFEIGWGTADNARKNIFAVGTDGTVKINETNMNDFVVEQGNGYRKWNSGLAECWVNTTQNVAINNAYGSLYQGTWTWSFAITFKGNPAVICSHFKWGTGASWGTVSASSTTNAVLRGFDVVSRTAGSCNITAYAIGRWK